MNKFISTICTLVFALFTTSVMAHESASHDTLMISDAWARTTLNRTVSGAAYMKIINTGEEADRLVGATSDVAEMVMVHRSYEDEDGIMKMDHVDHLEIAPNTYVTLAPGGYHVMMMRLAKPLTEGDSFKVTLQFEHAGDVDVTVKVTGIAGPTR